MTAIQPVSLPRQKWYRFAKLMVDVIDLEGQIKAYKKVFPNCKTKNTARVNSYRLLQKAEVLEIIEAGRREKEETIREAKRLERIRLAQQQVAHESELDAKMSEIAMGTFTRKKKTHAFNPEKKAFEIIAIEEAPTETDMIAAADKLYKRKGSYAATTMKHEGGDSFINFLAAIATVNNNNIHNAGSGSSESQV